MLPTTPIRLPSVQHPPLQPSNVSPGNCAEPAPKSDAVAVPHPLQQNIGALTPLGHTTALDGDFGSTDTNLDQRYAALAGLLPAMGASLPPLKSEQYARAALERTLHVINSLAVKLVEKSAEIVAAGDERQQHALEQSITRFLKRAESTMVDLAADTIREHLVVPPSPDLKKLVELVTNGLWRGIENMQKKLQRAFETPMGTGSSKVVPNASQRALLANHFAEEHATEFRAQLDAIQLVASERSDFDASKLSGIAALQLELNAVIALAHTAKSVTSTPAPAAAAPSAARRNQTGPTFGDTQELEEDSVFEEPSESEDEVQDEADEQQDGQPSNDPSDPFATSRNAGE